MDSNADDRMPPPLGFPLYYVPSFHSGRRSLPPPAAIDPNRAFSTYPSSTLQYYYPSPNQLALYSHLPQAPPSFSSHPQPLHGGVSGILPSVSQSRVPSLRHTPSFSPDHHLNNINDFSPSHSPHLDNQFCNSPSISEIIQTRDHISRATRSTTNSLPQPNRHYNDIFSVNLLISLLHVHDISPPSTPDLSTSHTSLLHDCFLSAPPPFLHHRSWDLTKPPNSYHEATLRSDSSVWYSAMQRELVSLDERKAFERTSLPPGRKAIGVRWTYDFKYHPDGSIIRGKEKARLVAQGFSQQPEDFGETYAPVVKLTSVHILLAFANHFDLEIMSFDVKTAFLHARLPHDIFVKQIPGFPEPNPSTVLRLLVALYGLKQSSHEWYKLLSSTLASLGLFRCEADHAVFIGHWTVPPHSSIPALPSTDPLFLIIPIHVDDGLAITNSLPLYTWFVKQVSATIDFVCLGPVLNTRYLGQRIIRDRGNKTIQLSQVDLIVALLEDWGMTDCKTSTIPLHHNPSNLPQPSPNACSDIPDDNLLSSYQRLVGSITYLAVCTRPDLAYAAMALGQFNSAPTRAHLVCAKGVLRYLANTTSLSLQFPSPPSSSTRLPDRSSASPTYGLSDADWASDEKDRKSVSGYSFFFLHSLVSWSSRKQRIVSTSSTESEYYALTNAIKEAIWLKLFLPSLIFLPLIPSPFFATIKVQWLKKMSQCLHDFERSNWCELIT